MAEKSNVSTLHESVVAARNTIEATVREAEELLGVRLTVHDVSGVFRGPGGEGLILKERCTHLHRCCVHAKQNSELCLKECQQYANRRSRKLGRPWVHTCWAALDEIVVPVIRDNAHMFTIFVGTFRSSGNTSLRFSEKYRVLREGTPVLPPRLMHRARTIVTTLGQGLLARIEQVNRLHHGGDGRKGAVRRFLNYHAHENVGLDDLAAVFNRSRSRTSHLVTELFGMSFKSLLLKERLARARVLLLSSPEWSVASVGRHVGLPDEYHFNRAFRRMYGLPPGKYRRANLVKSES